MKAFDFYHPVFFFHFSYDQMMVQATKVISPPQATQKLGSIGGSTTFH